MNRWKIFAVVGIVLLALTGTLYAVSAVWKLNVKPGLTVGDIVYADRKDRLTNLNAGSLGQVLEAQGASTAPAYVAKNTARRATIHNFVTLAASWTLSADELLCRYLAVTNANAACTVRINCTDGQTYVLRNASGQACQVIGPSGSGVSITSAKTAEIYYDSTNLEVYKVSSEF